jgi:N6-adenosine-specific RNA methylase IME4
MSEPKRYRTVVADPPWEYPGGFNGFGTRQPLPYASMSLDEIRAIPVADMLEREGYLYIWTTNKYLEHAFSVVRAWGCTPKQTLVWCKEPMGKGLGGMFVTTTEFIVVGQKIREGSNAHGKRTNGERVPTSWFQWKRPYRSDGKPMHSAKPDGFLDLVESVSPGPYLELFARRARFGWDYWGDQSLGTAEVAA